MKRIINKIDELTFLNENELTWDQVNSVLIDDNQTLKYLDYFIRHLSPNHQLPGKVFETFCGIGDWIREGKSTTEKQRQYIVLNSIAYWNERDLMAYF